MTNRRFSSLPTHADTFNRLVAYSIENNSIHRDLSAYCYKLGHDYSEVVEYIAAEVTTHRAA